MSHITDVKLKVTDLKILDEACDRLGLELKQNQKTYKWYGRYLGDSQLAEGHDPKTFGQCEHAISVKNAKDAYEIGLVNAADGTGGYDLLYDSYDGRIEPIAGRGLNTLRREYATGVTLRETTRTLGRQGFITTREDLPSGGVRLKVARRA